MDWLPSCTTGSQITCFVTTGYLHTYQWKQEFFGIPNPMWHCVLRLGLATFRPFTFLHSEGLRAINDKAVCLPQTVYQLSDGYFLATNLSTSFIVVGILGDHVAGSYGNKVGLFVHTLFIPCLYIVHTLFIPWTSVFARQQSGTEVGLAVACCFTLSWC